MNKVGNSTYAVLIYPRTSLDIGPSVAPPFALLTVAAPLYNKGKKVKIIDQRVDPNWISNLKEALKENPVCCGISTMTGRQIGFGIEIAKIIREETGRKIPIVWGGVHPTLVPEQTLRSPYADIVCVGEGDETFPELVDALENKKSLEGVKGIGFIKENEYVFTGARPFINIEETLPTPWDLIDVESYINPDLYLKESKRALDIGQTSRGCPYRCAFCYNPIVHKSRWRAMSVEKTLKMIISDVKRFKLDGIWLRDDEFFLDVDRTAKICQGILDAGLNIAWYTSGASVRDILRSSDEQLELLKRSGVNVLRFGAESGSDRVLKFINKSQTVKEILEVNRRCRKVGLKPVYSLMFGFPTETFAEINETIDLLFQLKKDNPDASFAQFAQFTAFPGTVLYDMAMNMGLKPPAKLEDWAEWLSNESDPKGERVPWLNKKERRWVGNILYLGNFSFVGADMASAVKNMPFGSLINFFVGIFSKYFTWRLKRKSYRFTPEMQPFILAFKTYMYFLNHRGK
ncbi:MAG: hypothetical protein COU10_01440 [Candidatus Harrisonbacteria bacterium CG10_big_fil_rev_8_21_14_0_10_45_28]|uniref:Uncharacterized protein n=1 Tax=Candidatus Harrisonbacteria bacterium CG10_big_fil_rev_8_21_14_0_10_45_28 TaxID=1974586 RepID=A0A2H0UQF7_9BACT|nr:MAG: hypothetical protein COU10_01440 [Candidatus Harrisonbacteria bacterium CG10_big_fil_rev_8_21_14_0_10_45_28]